MFKRVVIGGIFSGLFFCGLLFLPACKEYRRNRSHADMPLASIREGEALAKVYCQSCHLLPDPALLDSRSWEKGVLPNMGPRLGIFRNNFEHYPSSRNDTNLDKSFYPSQPLLKPEEWQHIVDYYTALSPDSLGAQSRSRPIRKGLPFFTALAPSVRYEMPATSFIRVDTTAGGRGLWRFDIHYGSLYRLDSSLRPVDSLRMTGAVVDMEQRGKDLVACNIGLLTPNNGKFGKAQSLVIGPDGKMKGDSLPLFDRLARPVQLTAADFNRDGREDWLACEFGNLTGALSWMENKGEGRYERHVIKAVPGAIRAVISDQNHDGLPDCWVLFAQGDESISLFTNEGGGRFSEQQVLRFPPMYGSSYFEMADFNKDGFPDIVYTCGDNADYSPVLKPYHGVYIFLNDGRNHFSQEYFFPIHGCYKAMARDFDGDGDLDIATISFFPDLDHQPEEGFIYLENLGETHANGRSGAMDFQPYSCAEAEGGKWLTMDAADLDGDGRMDIVLGNFSYFSSVTKAGVDFRKGPPFLLLKNKGR